MNKREQQRSLLGQAWVALWLVVCAVGSPMAVAGERVVAEAARDQEWARVRQLIREGADVNEALPDGMTALHWSAWHDNAAIAKSLLAAGAEADAENRYGVTPLFLACQNGNAELVAALLAKHVDIHRRLRGGETSLMVAARTGNVEVVRLLLKAGAEVDATERAGQTALMWAAAEGHSDTVSLLMEHGADPRRKLKSGFTAYFFAVREGRIAVVDTLLKAGIDVNAAMQPERRFKRSPRKGLSGLLLAVENGHFELAAKLLEQGADPNDQRSGYTALHVLSWVRKPNLGDGVDGDPPPIGSGKLTSLDMVRALVRHGADVNARLKRGSAGRARLNRTGATPFLMAADTADVPLMKVLLELGADPTIPNADHCPPILAAAGIGTMAPGEEAGTEEEAIAAVKLLLSLKADVNAVDDNGETAMHGAAYMNAPRLVEFLASHGADVRVWNRPNKYGWTPLQIAAGYRVGNFKPSPETVAALKEAMRKAGVTPPDKIAPPKGSGAAYGKR